MKELRYKKRKNLRFSEYRKNLFKNCHKYDKILKYKHLEFKAFYDTTPKIFLGKYYASSNYGKIKTIAFKYDIFFFIDYPGMLYIEKIEILNKRKLEDIQFYDEALSVLKIIINNIEKISKELKFGLIKVDSNRCLKINDKYFDKLTAGNIFLSTEFKNIGGGYYSKEI